MPDTNAEVDRLGTPSGESDTGTVAVPGRTELVEVVECVVVDERPSVVPAVVLLPVQVVKIVVQHEHTKTAGRHVMYIPWARLSSSSGCGSRARRPDTSGSCGRAATS